MRFSSKDLPAGVKFRKATADFKTDNLRLNIEDGSFDGQPLKGHLVLDDFDDPAVNGAMSGTLDLAYLEPFLPEEKGHKITGEMGFDVKVSGRVRDPRQMEFAGSMAVGEGSYRSKLLPEPIESFSIDAYFDNTVAHVNKLSAAMPSGHVDMSGRVTNLLPYLMADSMASPPRRRASRLLRAWPETRLGVALPIPIQTPREGRA